MTGTLRICVCLHDNSSSATDRTRVPVIPIRGFERRLIKITLKIKVKCSSLHCLFMLRVCTRCACGVLVRVMCSPCGDGAYVCDGSGGGW